MPEEVPPHDQVPPGFDGDPESQLTETNEQEKEQ